MMSHAPSRAGDPQIEVWDKANSVGGLYYVREFAYGQKYAVIYDNNGRECVAQCDADGEWTIMHPEEIIHRLSNADALYARL